METYFRKPPFFQKFSGNSKNENDPLLNKGGRFLETPHQSGGNNL